MAVRLTAKGALKTEILRLEDDRREYLEALEHERDKAARRDYRGLISEAEMRTQALRYALNFLEGEEEVECPD